MNQVLNGDCLSLFSQIKDNSIDITFADPPFNLKKKYNSHKDNLEIADYISWCDEWIREMVRVTKPTGSIFLHNIPKWLTFYSKTLNEIADFKHWISWEAPTAPMGKTLQPAHYGILFYAKNIKELKFYEIRSPHKRTRKANILAKDYGGKKAKLHPFGPLVSDVWTDIHRIKHNKYRDKHPCQLPIHLLERVILMSTDENDIVLDPFVGTGTSAVAAKRLNRQYIGFDIDDNYVKITQEKLEEEQFISKLNSAYVSYYLDDIVTIRDADWEIIKNEFIIPNDVKDIDLQKIHLKRNGIKHFYKRESKAENLRLFEKKSEYKSGEYEE
jgi:site-specific DNA-methyltransferase (adenine-specific)